MLLGTRRMDNSVDRAKFDKRQKTIDSMSENKEITIFSESNDSPQKFSMVTLIAVLTTLSNKSEEKPSRFCSRSENDLEIFCGKKYITSKSSNAPAQYSFEDPIE